MSRSLSTKDVQAFRDKLCAIAATRFAQDGYSGVTMRSLAKAAGCSPMTPYRYFKSKAEILAVLRADALRRLSDACEAAMAHHSDARDASTAMAQAYLEFALEDSDSYRIIFELDQPDEEEFPELVEQSERNRQVLNSATERMIEAGYFDGDVDLLSHIFWAGMHGVIVLHLAGKLSGDIKLDKLYTNMMATLTRGTRARPVSA